MQTLICIEISTGVQKKFVSGFQNKKTNNFEKAVTQPHIEQWDLAFFESWSMSELLFKALQIRQKSTRYDNSQKIYTK